jgi:hypothetical protein
VSFKSVTYHYVTNAGMLSGRMMGIGFGLGHGNCLGSGGGNISRPQNIGIFGVRR